MLCWKRLCTLSLCLLACTSFAQTVTFRNSETGEPVAGLLVFSESNKAGLLTDKSGQIDLKYFEKDEVLFLSHVSFPLIKILKSVLVRRGEYQITELSRNLDPIYIDHPLRYFLVEADDPGQVQRIDSRIARLENPQTSADMLQNTGQISIQKSQGGGGSPTLRGFEANKILLMVDGIRMNNAIYRSGHLQNAITIDNAILEKTDVIFGPSSSLYGSDALGGVLHFHTIDPEIIRRDTVHVSGAANFRYNTNGNSLTGHFHMDLGKNNWGFLTSITANKFGDFEMGKYRAHGNLNWGIHNYYVDQVGGADSMLVNGDSTVQRSSGYSQLDFLEKFVYSPSDRFKLTFNFQYSTSTEIYRYDALTEYNGSNLKWAEWYYGPQKRMLGAMIINFKPKSNWVDNSAISVSWQRIDEDRISRRFQSDSREYQFEDVNVLGVNADFTKIFPKSRMIFYGLEIQYNDAKSSAETRNINDDSKSILQTRYPPQSQYLSSGIYFEFKKKFAKRAVFSTGARYSLIYANSVFIDTNFVQLPFDKVSFVASAPSGNIGFVFNPDSTTRIKSMITTGFRAPNIDDYGKVFEQGGFTVVPNDNVKPEYAVGFEFTGEKSIFNRRISIGGTAYMTLLFNAIVRRDFTLNGQDSILYNGEMTRIQANVNTDRATIFGFSTYLKLKLTEGLGFHYTYNYAYGVDVSAGGPLSHIPPQFGKIELSHKWKNINSAVYSIYNFRKDLNTYGSGEDNLDLTPSAQGTPPWWTLNARFSWRPFMEILELQISAENLLDVHYRQFASGISAPGRSFLFSVRVDF